MPQIFRAGAVSCRAAVNNTEENLAVISRWTEKAAQSGVNLLLFPELSLTGYSTGGDLEPLTAASPACRGLAELARRHSMTLAAGMAWLDGTPGVSHLAHGLWLPSGQLHIYYKTHLGQREKKYYAPGHYLPVFHLPGIKVGVQLCLEQHFPEITQTLVLKGAQLILCPHATPRLSAPERRESWHISLRARAYDNCVFVLAANQAGDNGRGIAYHGGAMLINPFGQVLAEDFSGQAALIYADIDLDQIDAARTTPQGTCLRFYPPRRRPELYK